MLISLLFIAVMGMLTLTLASCQLMEINIVQRATVSNGDGTTSKQHDSTAKREEDRMELIVPFK